MTLGANIQQGGGNDSTPLHAVISRHDEKMVRLLLSHGADTNTRTRIDDYAMPFEEAEILGLTDMVTLLCCHDCG